MHNPPDPFKVVLCAAILGTIPFLVGLAVGSYWGWEEQLLHENQTTLRAFIAPLAAATFWLAFRLYQTLFSPKSP